MTELKALDSLTPNAPHGYVRVSSSGVVNSLPLAEGETLRDAAPPEPTPEEIIATQAARIAELEAAIEPWKDEVLRIECRHPMNEPNAFYVMNDRHYSDIRRLAAALKGPAR